MKKCRHFSTRNKPLHWPGCVVYAQKCLAMRTFLVANYVGDASFAFTGSLAAGVAGMDLLGCNMVGFITALGGGSWR